MLFLLLRVVFQIIPHAVGHAQEFIPELFRVPDGIPVAAGFEIPEIFLNAAKVRAAVHQFFPGDLFCKCRGGIGMLLGRFLRLQENAVPHGARIRFFRFNTLLKFAPRFPALPERGPGQRGENAVPGTVGKEFCPHPVKALRGHLPAGDRTDLSVFHFRIHARAVEQQKDLRFTAHCFIQNAVPD